MFQLQLATELQSRAQLLSQEISFWQRLAKSNERRRGIHLSQIQALSILLKELERRQNTLLDDLDPAAPATEFALKRREIEEELSYLHGVAGIFRHILAQRDDPIYYRVILDAADLTAASCYLDAIYLARQWGAIKDDCYREPPLTYLNADISPAVRARGYTLDTFKFPLDSYREKELPIPVISIPFHHASALWTFCTLYHEVGHILDNELHLSQPMEIVLRQHLVNERVDEQRIGNWVWWTPELIADTFGILFGGLGFAYTLVKLLLLPEKAVSQADLVESHPPPYLRIRLLIELLKKIGVTNLGTVADTLLTAGGAWFGESRALEEYLSDCETVVTVLLDAQLVETLQAHSLRDFCIEIKAQHDQVELLARYLRFWVRQPINKETWRRYHFIPAAAQIAVQMASESVSASDLPLALVQIHNRALRLFQNAHTIYLDGDPEAILTSKRQEYLRQITAAIDFRPKRGGEANIHRYG